MLPRMISALFNKPKPFEVGIFLEMLPEVDGLLDPNFFVQNGDKKQKKRNKGLMDGAWRKKRVMEVKIKGCKSCKP